VTESKVETENGLKEKSEEKSKEKSEDKLLVTETTLVERGANLPLGILNDEGAWATDIAVRPWRMKEEKALGKLRDENRNINFAQYVSMVLAVMCSRLGPHDFNSIEDMAKRRVHIGQMWLGDVFYAYCWLRYRSLGSELALDITCPFSSCGNQFAYYADLRTLEVSTAKKLEDTYWEYTLRDPFEIRGKEATGFVFGPMRWSSLESMGSVVTEFNQGAQKAEAIRFSIHKLKGSSENIALADGELDDMSKYDIEAITAKIDTNSIGPNMAIEDNCPKCRRKFRMTIDWTYENFFGISSPSAKRQS